MYLKEKEIFGLDPSCVLYLPFYKYGGEQQKIWDTSGNNNHGTIYGACPTPYPILSGTDLVTNGGMENGNPPTGWFPAYDPTIFERSSTYKRSGSYSARCVVDGSSGFVAGFVQPILDKVEPDKTYKISFWYNVPSHSGPNLIAQVLGSEGSLGIMYFGATTTWEYGEFNFKMPSSLPVYLNIVFQRATSATTAEFYIDDVSVQEVVDYETLGYGFDGVDDYIEVPHSDSISISDNLSILFWIRPQYRVGVPLGGFSKLNNTNDANYACYILSTSGTPSGIIFYANRGGSWGAISDNVGLTNYINNWVCIGFEYNSSVGGQIYINGIPQGSRTGSGTLATNTQPLKIGYVWASEYGRSHFGEFLLFNRRLSAQEIMNYYQLTRRRYGI